MPLLLFPPLLIQLHWRKELKLLSDLAYCGLTTFSGYQIQGAQVYLHSLFPYLLDKLLVCLENELETREESQGGGGQRAELTEPQRRMCMLVLLALQPALSIIHRLHVALFYISGAFYHLGNKTASIRYVGICL
uniref:RING-type E3 ubiquitin transferase n=1 Tax=Oncorhynchus tshawytscha TaxID=74940 RepID=A0AAZ3NRQ5_ONCTS